MKIGDKLNLWQYAQVAALRIPLKQWPSIPVLLRNHTPNAKSHLKNKIPTATKKRIVGWHSFPCPFIGGKKILDLSGLSSDSLHSKISYGHFFWELIFTLYFFVIYTFFCLLTKKIHAFLILKNKKKGVNIECEYQFSFFSWTEFVRGVLC